MENQTTAPVEQSEQPKDVAQPEATPEVKETVLAEATTEQQQEEPRDRQAGAARRDPECPRTPAGEAFRGEVIHEHRPRPTRSTCRDS